MTDTPAPTTEAATEAATAIVYRGAHDGPSGAATVWLEDPTRPGTPLGTLTHRTGPDSHSPTGYSWGFAGSGPAELARALLIDALGDDGRCTTCRGACRVVYLPDAGPFDEPVPLDGDHAALIAAGTAEVLRCGSCDGTGSAVSRPEYQQYKFDVVARLPEREWTLTRAEVRAWHDRYTAAQGTA